MPLLDTLPVGTAGRGLRLGALSAFTSAVAQSVWRGNVPLSGIDLSDRIATSGAKDLILMQQALCLAGAFTDSLRRRRSSELDLRGLAPPALDHCQLPHHRREVWRRGTGCF